MQPNNPENQKTNIEPIKPQGKLGNWLSTHVEEMAKTARHPMFWISAKEMAGIAAGLSAWGFMTGVAMVKSGMSISESVLMSIMVFAGSAQLAAIPLLAAGAPLWVIFATAFCVNLRFVVFSLHLRDYLMFLPRGKRLWLGYLTGDVTYVLFTRRFPTIAKTPAKKKAQLAYLWGGVICNALFWQVSSLLGIFLGSALPASWGLEFAGTLALLAVTLSLATTKNRTFSALIAGIAAIAFYSLSYRLNIVTAIALAVAASLAYEKILERKGENA